METKYMQLLDGTKMGTSIQKRRVLEILNAECYNVTVIFIALWLHYCYYKFQPCQSPVVAETIVIAPGSLHCKLKLKITGMWGKQTKGVGKNNVI